LAPGRPADAAPCIRHWLGNVGPHFPPAVLRVAGHVAGAPEAVVSLVDVAQAGAMV